MTNLIFRLDKNGLIPIFLIANNKHGLNNNIINNIKKIYYTFIYIYVLMCFVSLALGNFRCKASSTQHCLFLFTLTKQMYNCENDNVRFNLWIIENLLLNKINI